MITALIHAEGLPEELAATLAALVPAVVEGLVGDAVIVAGQDDPELTAISELSGAKLVLVSPDIDPWRAGAALARREWLLCLRSGDVPREGWMRAVDRFVATATRTGQPLGRLARRPPRLASVFADFAGQLVGQGHARAGDLARRDWLLARDQVRARAVRIGAAVERDVVLR
jgi:hypothetical protein